MKELELEFDGKGEVNIFRFKQIKKGNNAYIYMVSLKHNPDIQWYEVFKRMECKETDVVLNGQSIHYEAKVRYPSANDFGVNAFCCQTMNKALEHFTTWEDKEKK